MIDDLKLSTTTTTRLGQSIIASSLSLCGRSTGYRMEGLVKIGPWGGRAAATSGTSWPPASRRIVSRAVADPENLTSLGDKESKTLNSKHIETYGTSKI